MITHILADSRQSYVCAFHMSLSHTDSVTFSISSIWSRPVMSCTGKKGDVDTSGNEIYQLHCSSGSDTAERVTLQYCILH